MDYNKFKEYIIKYSKEENIDEYELYYVNGQSTSIQAYEGEIENFEHSSGLGVSYRSKINGKIGYSATQDLSEAEAKRLIADAKSYGAVLDDNPHTIIYSGSSDYEKVELSKKDQDNVEFLKATALEIEKKALEKDKKIQSVPYALAEYSYSERAIYNSFGVDLHDSSSYYTTYCEVIAADETKRKYTGGDFQYTLTKEELDTDKLVNTAVKEALDFIGSKRIKSGSYPVVFDNNMAGEIISVFSSVFSSDNVQKGLSLLKDKEGEIIASPLFNIIEDPMSEMSVIKSAFDDEGHRTFKKDIVKDGRLETLIYNLETASKADKKSTGNGMKSGYTSKVGVSFSNLYLDKGKISLEEMVKNIKEGVYITELKGMHASADATSGDFSLESKGFFIKDGKIDYPIEQFTIAGNFFKMIKNITGVADNLKFRGTIGAPSFLVENLSVSGDDE